MDKRFLYVADPMCSWCWGFAPVMEKIEQEFGEVAPVHVVVGGLRPGTTEAMRDQDKSYIRDHWNHVQEASGQPFDFSFFDQEGFIYDTEPACRATVAARSLDEAKTLPFLRQLHQAFYAENKDTTDDTVLADIAEETGYPRGEFELTLASPEIREETQDDFRFAQQSGITGFPSLFAIEDRQPYRVTAGYQKWENLVEPLTGWVNGTSKLG